MLIRCNDARNNCLTLNDGNIIVVENVVSDKNGVTLVGKYMEICGNLYSAPCGSADVGIHVVVPKNDLVSCDLNSVHIKMWRVPYNDRCIVFPLMHTENIS